MRAVPYLEGSAKKYALAAVDAEKRGDYESAIINLNKAIEYLTEIVRNYPDYPLAHIYRRLIAQYRKKAKDLERKARMIPASGDEVYVDTRGEDGGGDGDEAPEFVLKEKPSITFEDIAGLEEAKKAIREAIVFPVKRPDLFPLGWPRGILLYGPPGTGKTMLASAVANEIDGEFLYVDAANIMSKWLGEGEKNVKKLFNYARKKAKEGKPVVIFIDEVDALLGVHGSEVGGEVRVRNQFLKEMDGIQDKGSRLHVYVIAATNKPWKLDEPFIRRFQKRIYVPLPSRETRRRMLEMYTRKLRLSGDVDLDRLSEMLEGYTGSDIADIVREAYMATVRELFEKGKIDGEPRPITMSDFKEILQRRRPSVDHRLLKAYEEWTERFAAV
ncbi:ATP-binding protein [Aeropyrum camini]|uniref:ATPase of the AAA class n=1 Tax=Aeropyrum camini SY1 = JCM 12091 TaxID=1198449 RepID=U3TFK0_9CREN|nr:ATP-binding protein [Aeropyrum camini]BAN90099.1 ATPase of the AAA class [Aeropyrum camini SY1 = JCM 12091]